MAMCEALYSYCSEVYQKENPDFLVQQMSTTEIPRDLSLFNYFSVYSLFFANHYLMYMLQMIFITLERILFSNSQDSVATCEAHACSSTSVDPEQAGWSRVLLRLRVL